MRVVMRSRQRRSQVKPMKGYQDEETNEEEPGTMTKMGDEDNKAQRRMRADFALTLLRRSDETGVSGATNTTNQQ